MVCSYLLVLEASSLVHAAELATTLSEDQKTEKRLLFNQYVEDELARAAKRKYEQQKQKRVDEVKTPWLSKFSVVTGHDNNVNLTSMRKGDGYFQETAEGFFKFDRPEIRPLVWPGKIGVNWYGEIFNYGSITATDYETLTISAFTEDKFNETISLKTAYDFTLIHYDYNDQLNYSEHKIKPTLIHALAKGLSHQVFVVGDVKLFRDRMAVNEAYLPDDDFRRDHYYEAGHGVRWSPNPETYIGTTLAWKKNDSNDKFNRYNDYDGYKANGYVYRKLTERFSTVVLGGYDHKDYRSRLFTADRVSQTQADDFFYAGSYLYYDISANFQATISYLYKQNYSNDASMEYSGATVSGGLSINF